MRFSKTSIPAFATLLWIWPSTAEPCTNFLITPEATIDGSALITYSADSHDLYGELYFTPARDHKPGAIREIIEWDTGKRLGEIPEIPHTFRVVGNLNEYQVAIGETTFGGRIELRHPDATIDYGSLMYIALERSRTAREAISVMTDLVERFGYASKGESFSISDPTEVWLLEMVGKGPGKLGANWVARRVPKGFVSAHANQARIRQFPLSDTSSTLYSRDVITFARERGYFNGQDHEFSFADAYAPLDFSALRIGEARVWSFFRNVAPSNEISPKWVMGDVSATPLPLWVKPDRKLSAQDTMALMRDHHTDSPMAFSDDVGAGPYHLPYRWRPLYWNLDGEKYFNERSISTQQTGFSFVAQSRSELPNSIGGIFWFGVDDTNTTVYVPIFAGVTRPPKPFAVGTGDFHTFTWDSAFWAFNFVSNYAYSRYADMVKDIREVQAELEGQFAECVPEVEKVALKLHAHSPVRAREYLTEFSIEASELTLQRWRRLGQDLIMKYLDGNVRDRTGHPTHPGYPEEWYRRVVEETGQQYLYKKIPNEMGYYTSRDELDTRAAELPPGFDFSKNKIWLHPGTAKCGQPPRCCLETIVRDKKLRVLVPRQSPSETEERQRRRCGEPGWLVPVTKGEERNVVPLFEINNSPGG
ncbi:dipeptidase [Myxococcota bacterium]